jgi:hypothetical protein
MRGFHAGVVEMHSGGEEEEGLCNEGSGVSTHIRPLDPYI